MASRRRAKLVFPMGGLNREAPYQDQPPYTTPDCRNVRPWDTTERRQRGGNRPGVSKAFTAQIGGSTGYPIRFMDIAHIVDTTGARTYIDNFDVISSVWSFGGVATRSWMCSNLYSESGLISASDMHGYMTADTWNGGAVAPVAWPYYARPYLLHAEFSPWNTNAGYTLTAFHYGSVFLDFGFHFGVKSDLTTGWWVGAAWAAGGTVTIQWYNGGSLVASSTITASAFSYCTAKLAITPNGANWDATFTLTDGYGVEHSSTRTAITLAGHAWGPAMATNPGVPGPAPKYNNSVDWAKCDYAYGTTSQGGDVLVASANGELWRKTPALTQPAICATAGTCTLASDRPLRSAGRADKVYIADTAVPYFTHARIAGASFPITGTGGDAAKVFCTLPSAAAETYIDANKADLVAVLTDFEDSTGNLMLGVYGITDSFYSATPGASYLTLCTGVDPTTGSDIAAAFTVAKKCKVTIVRGPKYYDATADKTFRWLAETSGAGGAVFKGVLPTECPLICRYLNRIVTAGAPYAPHVWTMCRAGYPNDWEVGSSTSPTTAAVAGTATSEGGTIADPITALVPFSDDYLVIACLNSLWVMRGDPGNGGSFDCVDRQVGIVSAGAWCFGPSNELYFLSDDGIYVLPPGASGRAEAISKNSLPNELLSVNASQYHISMAWDNVAGGIHLYLTPIDGSSNTHWFIDVQSRSMWPVFFDGTWARQPTCQLVWPGFLDGDSRVILGGQDGYLRRYVDSMYTDEGDDIASYLVLGPFAIGDGQFLDGIVTEMTPFLDSESTAINWTLVTGDTAEEALARYEVGELDASGQFGGTSGTFANHVRCRGTYAVLSMQSDTAGHWCFESLAMTTMLAGRRKRL